MREGVLRAGALGLRDRALEPFDRITRAPLILKHASVPVVQMRPLPRSRVALDTFDQAQRLGQAAKGLRIVPEPHPHDSLLLDQPRLLHGLAAPECARLLVRARRVFVCRHPHPHVAEQLPDARDLLAGGLGPRLRRLERAFEELRRLDVRVLLLGPPRRLDRVAPRFRPAFGAVVVQRQKLRRLVCPIPLAAADHVRHAAVELTAAPVGEALVCAVADERMTEAEAPRYVGVALDELGQPVPGLGVRRGSGVSLEHVGDHGT